MSESTERHCAGSQSFPTSYNGEFTRCPVCKRKLKLHVNGRVPTHNPPQRRGLYDNLTLRDRSRGRAQSRVIGGIR